MVNVAVICVALATVVLLTVIPAPLTPMVAPATKCVPVSVTATLWPCPPLFGLIEVSVGGARFTVNGCAPLVPPEVVTVTFRAPVGALPAMVNVAVICVVLTTVVLLTVIPAPLRPIVAPAIKFVPVSVTATLCPCTPFFGVIEVSVGGARFTVNGCAPLVPPEVVTVTFRAPVAALLAMANVAVICVALTTVVLLTVIPAPLRPIVDPATKFVPVSVTGTLCPCTPLFGLIEVSVGGARFTVNGCAPLVPPEVVTVTFRAPVAALL